MNDSMVSINPNDWKPIRKVKARVFISGNQLFSYFPSKLRTVLIYAVYVINGERIIFVDFWIGYVGQYHRWKRCNAGDVYGFLTIFIFSIKITDSFGLRRLCNKWVGFIFAGLGN